MKANVMLRGFCIVAAFCFGATFLVWEVRAQDVGAEVGGGAGIFRAKNPETKKSSTKPTTSGTKPTTRTPSRTTRPSNAALEERIEDLLDKGNEARDARRFAEAEQSYQGVLKLKPRDGRAAYGLGNVYSDQQRWSD